MTGRLTITHTHTQTQTHRERGREIEKWGERGTKIEEGIRKRISAVS